MTDLQQARDYLQALADQNGGRLTAAQVVQAAQPEDSPLHPFFEWDDGRAANRHREDQARELIRSLRIEFRVERRKVSTVAFVRDPERDPGEQGYIRVDKIRSDEDVAREVLAAEFQRAAAALKRARQLAAVFDMEDDVQSFIEQLHLLGAKLQPVADR